MFLGFFVGLLEALFGFTGYPSVGILEAHFDFVWYLCVGFKAPFGFSGCSVVGY